MPQQTNPVLSAIDTGLSLASNEVSVYFATDGERVDFIDNHGDWTSYERAQVMSALDRYAAIADLSFAITDDIETATFKLTKSASEHGSLGFMNPPDPSYGNTQGVAWFNTYSYWSGETAGMLDPGSYTFTIFLHEFGHGLGLAHPHDTGQGSTLMPDIGDGFGLDQGAYTVMTYHDGWPDAPEGTPSSRTWGWNLGPSALDIAVIQEKYGANQTTGAGETTYVLQTQNASGTGYIAIWDVGGTDRIIHNGSQSAIIDLRAASLLPEIGGGGYVSHVQGIHGGFTIAHGVIIETAKGGRGDDIITGNNAANMLLGRGGADKLMGGKGGDTLYGARGADRLDGANGRDLLFGGNGKDALSGGRGNDTLHGGNGSDILNGGRGSDLLSGGRGPDVFVFAPNGGNDTVTDFTSMDLIDLTAFELASFTDVNIDVFGGDIQLEISGLTITLMLVSPNDLNEALFLL